MNSFYKSIKMTALAVVAVIGLVGCQKEKTDLSAIDNQLARQTMLGTYTYLVQDSAKMRTTIHEWQLRKVNGVQEGSYLTRVVGEVTPSETSTTFTWEASMTEDNLKMNMVLNFADGTQKEAVWSDGVITIDNYTTGKVANSIVATSKTIGETFENLHFVHADTTYFVRDDSIPYLAWKTDVTFFAPEDTATAKQNYLDELAQYTDTIIWYLTNVGAIGDIRIDTIAGEPVLVNLVVVDTTASKRGKNKGKHGITHPINYPDTMIAEVKVGLEKILYSAMNFDRSESGVNTGSYSLHQQTWTLECYDNPTSAKAIATDSISNVTNAHWMVTTITNQRKFDVLLHGDVYNKYTRTVGGEVKTNEEKSVPNTYVTLSLSGYVTSSGEVEQSGLNYKLIKE